MGFYATTVWRYPNAPKWHSVLDVDLPPGAGAVVASADFGVPQIDTSFEPDQQNYPNIQLFGWDDLPNPAPMDADNVLHENTTDPFQETGWILSSGWVVWVRWHFYVGETEVLVPPGATPAGTFRGPDAFRDPKWINNLLVPAGAPPWEYEMHVPAEVTRMVCDMEYNGDGAGDGSPGYGAKTVHNLWVPDQPDREWPYKDPELSGGGGDAGVFRVS